MEATRLIKNSFNTNKLGFILAFIVTYFSEKFFNFNLRDHTDISIFNILIYFFIFHLFFKEKFFTTSKKYILGIVAIFIYIFTSKYIILHGNWKDLIIVFLHNLLFYYSFYILLNKDVTKEKSKVFLLTFITAKINLLTFSIMPFFTSFFDFSSLFLIYLKNIFICAVLKSESNEFYDKIDGKLFKIFIKMLLLAVIYSIIPALILTFAILKYNHKTFLIILVLVLNIPFYLISKYISKNILLLFEKINLPFFDFRLMFKNYVFLLIIALASTFYLYTIQFYFIFRTMFELFSIISLFLVSYYFFIYITFFYYRKKLSIEITFITYLKKFFLTNTNLIIIFTIFNFSILKNFSDYKIIFSPFEILVFIYIYLFIVAKIVFYIVDYSDPNIKVKYSSPINKIKQSKYIHVNRRLKEKKGIYYCR